ncbi:MAG: hypothetical protein WC588_04810 [Candidatus Micrarchaeia archaeon]
MQTRTVPAFMLFLALFCSAIFPADGGDIGSMRQYCLTILNATGDLKCQAVPDDFVNETPEEFNYTHSEGYRDALAELQRANASVAKLRAEGIPYQRSRDIFTTAYQWFEGQGALELTGGQGSYSFVFDKVREIRNIERTAFAADDELRALSVRLQGIDPGIDLSGVRFLESDAKKEFADGRFEEAQRIARQAYETVSDAESEAEHSKTLAESARKNIETFFAENWQTMLTIAIVAGVLFFLFQKRIRKYMVESKIRSLAGERMVLETMLQGLQKDYFQHGKINDLSYHIKTKKYSDLIRAINRQLPLLREELKKL